MTTDVVREVSQKPGYRKHCAQTLPVFFLLAVAHSVGGLVGTVFGPGASPLELD